MYLASIADQQAGKGAKQVNQNMQINPTQQVETVMISVSCLILFTRLEVDTQGNITKDKCHLELRPAITQMFDIYVFEMQLT